CVQQKEHAKGMTNRLLFYVISLAINCFNDTFFQQMIEPFEQRLLAHTKLRFQLLKRRNTVADVEFIRFNQCIDVIYQLHVFHALRGTSWNIDWVCLHTFAKIYKYHNKPNQFLRAEPFCQHYFWI